jgi:hypothetical protein
MRAHLASLCLLVAVAQTVIAGRGFVFCIEPGGDVSIEAAGADACCPTEGGGTDAPAAGAASEPPCPCVDVAFDPSTAVNRSDELNPDLHGSILALPGTQLVVLRQPLPIGACAPDALQRAAPARLLVGTVVLRI